ncbi:hypothetical protein ACQUQU_09110 [Thalassolituus sp. LLYu03]|uniref:hypothetical protein n=1 Tax=Thalassolituus sp. LLYu03 TaxID=3421656 RepID=UPI003D2ACE2F
MDELRQQQLKRQIRQALGDIDAMKAQLADVRDCCAELAEAMRRIREESQRAMADAERRRKIRRVV